MNQISKDDLAMLSGFKDHTVNAVLVQLKEPCCPPNTVTLSNGQNNPLNGLLVIVGVHENSVTVL